MLIAVSSASQFAGVIHWLSLVILSVFFSEVSGMSSKLIVQLTEMVEDLVEAWVDVLLA